MIKELFKKLFCCHDYEVKIKEKINLSSKTPDVRRMNYLDIYVGEREENYQLLFIVMVCKKCGKKIVIEEKI